MKKSRSITLTLMASMALVSCGRSRRCVDAAGQTASDALCTGPAVRPGYHWLYFSSGRSTFVHGSSGVRSGSSSSDGVSRGGFGSTGASHASGSAGGHGAGE
jgi:hypothetical protein